MYCKHCGAEIADDAIFCSQCGTKQIEDKPVPPAAPAGAAKAAAAGISGAAAVKEAAKAAADAEAPRRPFLEEMQWDVSEYPDSNTVEKTEDIDFNWNLDPEEIPDQVRRPAVPPVREPRPPKSPETDRVSRIFDRVVPAAVAAGEGAPEHPVYREPAPEAPVYREPAPEAPVYREPAPEAPEAPVYREPAPERPVRREPAAHSMSGPKSPTWEIPSWGASEGEAVIGPAEEEIPKSAEELSQFHTLNRKNAEFQQLLNREYEKVMGSGTIGSEISEAEEAASRRFDSHQEELSMDQFLEKEGVVSLYEPKEFQSDVLARIEAQEKAREQRKAEEEARIQRLEQERAEAEARRREEEARLNAEAEASAAAAEEIRLAEEADLRRRTEADEKRRAEAEAARLAALARRQEEEEARALEEARRREAEEARLRAEEEARLAAEEEARRQAEEEARRQAEEEARLRAEAELRAAEEAARIRAEQEARLAAEEEAAFRAEQLRRQREAETARLRKENEARQRAREEKSAAVEAEVRRALEQTSRMRAEEEEKIKAALAGIRGGRFTDTISAGAKKEEPAASAPEEKKPAAEALPAIDVQQLMEVPAEEAPKQEAPKQEAPKQEAPAAAAYEPAQVFAGADEQPAAEEMFLETVEETAAQEAAPAEQEVKSLAAEAEIEEAHRRTKEQIDEMARARESFFEDFPDAEDLAAREKVQDLTGTRLVDKDAIAAGIKSSTKKLSREDLHHIEEELQVQAEQAAAEEDEFFRQFEEPAAPEAPAAMSEAPAAMAEAPAAMAEIPAAAEAAREIADSTVSAPADTKARLDGALEDIDDLLSQFASVTDNIRAQHDSVAPLPQEMAADLAESVFEEQKEVPAPAEELAFEPAPAEELAFEPAPAEELAFEPAEMISDNPGLEDTMVMPKSSLDSISAEKEGFDPKEAEQLRKLQEANDEEAKKAEAVKEPEKQLSAKELKRLEKEKAKEAKRQAKAQKKAAKAAAEEDFFDDGDDFEQEEEVRKGGAGRVVLMIILILLCLIFALELAGIGIKMAAPTSGAAEFIDNILNSLIQLITG